MTDTAVDLTSVGGHSDADYETFAREALRIRSKPGPLVPFIFNRAQRYVHHQLEAQKAQTGSVRALILKGRQQGCSTYVAGRFYHRVTRERGQRVFILTNSEASTANLFEIVDRFRELAAGAPATRVRNTTELRFAALDSGYKVGTAGTKDVGRSATVQLLHGSEVAFWPHGHGHAAGALQAVSDAAGTEIILESTANGIGNFFHQTWRDAETSSNDFIAVFVPWFWQEEYRKPLSDNFALDQEEADYAAQHGLDLEQMAWRRAKIVELKDARLFKQEYPACVAEAFQMSGDESFIAPELMARARKAQCEPMGPLVIGYDPAWMGNGRHAMAWRRGRRLIKVETRLRLDTVEAARWARQVIDADKPERFVIDVGGVGGGVYDQLRHLGPPYAKIVEQVNFGKPPLDAPLRDEQGRPAGGPLNRRAELWMKSKQWLQDAAGVQVPDSDALHADACAPRYGYDSLTRLRLEGKDDMRRRGALSPDEWDAVALTFAAPATPTTHHPSRPSLRSGASG